MGSCRYSFDSKSRMFIRRYSTFLFYEFVAGKPCLFWCPLLQTETNVCYERKLKNEPKGEMVKTKQFS